jgi:hypothetical protein
LESRIDDVAAEDKVGGPRGPDLEDQVAAGAKDDRQVQGKEVDCPNPNRLVVMLRRHPDRSQVEHHVALGPGLHFMQNILPVVGEKEQAGREHGKAAGGLEVELQVQRNRRVVKAG